MDESAKIAYEAPGSGLLGVNQMNQAGLMARKAQAIMENSAPSQPTMLGKIAELETRLRKLHSRAVAVGDELNGPIPAEGAEAKVVSRCLHERVDSCHVIICRIEEAVLRLENSIGRDASSQFGLGQAVKGY